MHPEIENLINMALADGDVSEKEKAIILRKAESLGIDIDEVEMILDGKLHQLEANKTKQKEKVGNIVVCPSCGANTESFQTNCKDCGHEFRNTKANSVLLKLIEDIEKINNKEIPLNSLSKLSPYKQQYIELERKKLKNELIQNLPVPNDKENILELLAYSITKAKDNSGFNLQSQILKNIDESHSISDAWGKKAEEIIFKSKIMFKNDEFFYKQILQYESDFKSARNKSKTLRIVIIVFFALLFLFVFGGIFISSMINK